MAVTVTVRTSTANPAPMSLTGEFPAGSATFTGQATNVSLALDDARGCHAVVGVGRVWTSAWKRPRPGSGLHP